jgi:RND family efflux transporter MFP subunit
LQAARAELAKAQANFERGATLVEQKFISETEYDQLKAKRGVARARVSTARKALEDAALRAPFAGVVAKRYIENHTDVQAKQRILSLQNVAALEVVVDVPERLVAMRQRDRQGVLVAEFDSVPGKTFPLWV